MACFASQFTSFRTSTSLALSVLFIFYIFYCVYILYMLGASPTLFYRFLPCAMHDTLSLPNAVYAPWCENLKNHNKNTNRYTYTHTHHHPCPTPTSLQAYSASRRSRTAMTLSVRPARLNSLPDCAGGTGVVVTHRAANGKMGVEDEDEEDESRNLVPAIPSDPFKLHTQHPRTPMTPMGPENAQ